MTADRGVRALFSGPSGTGKTLAARYLAGCLSLDIYRVNLATVVNKYIGVTERNLDKVLTIAEELGVVLLLDEGDSLMARRTEVNDANDRYANLETNFLLQRLESFSGIVLITSNAAARIDRAFLRRIDITVDFLPPNPEQRWQILAAHLPARHAVSDATMTEIARRCSLTGGVIRNAALHASLLAMDDGVPLPTGTCSPRYAGSTGGPAAPAHCREQDEVPAASPCRSGDVHQSVFGEQHERVVADHVLAQQGLEAFTDGRHIAHPHTANVEHHPDPGRSNALLRGNSPTSAFRLPARTIERLYRVRGWCADALRMRRIDARFQQIESLDLHCDISLGMEILRHRAAQHFAGAWSQEPFRVLPTRSKTLLERGSGVQLRYAPQGDLPRLVGLVLLRFLRPPLADVLLDHRHAEKPQPRSHRQTSCHRANSG